MFLNDVSICTDDILELLYQKVGTPCQAIARHGTVNLSKFPTFLTLVREVHLHAHVTCPMDGSTTVTPFMTGRIARGITGDMFIEIPQSGAFGPQGKLVLE